MNDKKILFQIIDWSENCDVITEVDENDREYENKLYTIRVYGRDEENNSIFLKIKNFKPYFYIQIPIKWKDNEVRSLINHFKFNVNKYALNGFDTYEVEEKHNFYGFTDYSKFKFIKLIFFNITAFYAFKKLINEKSNYPPEIFKKPTKIKIFESVIKPMLKYLHIKDVLACGWIEVSNFKKLSSSLTYCNRNISCDWEDTVSVKMDKVQKFIIASYDIECMSSTGLFPNALLDGDCITQIGTVFSYYGDNEPYMTHIITLNSCDRIKGLENTIIECYDNERQVLKAWTKLIQRIDPDIITGYNINKFDFKYMHDRAEKLGVLSDLQMLSRHKNEPSKYITPENSKAGSSKAFGDNELFYFQMDGRVLIDLMTYARRNLSLSSYKLDNVASTYINEKIKKFVNFDKTSIIYTNSVYGIKEEQFITISYFDGLTDNTHDDKYKILKIDNDGELIDGKKFCKIIVDGIVPMDIMKYKKINWCHAKDDVSPKDLFRLFKGNGYDRGIIAKYCIMDCVLVIKLLEKLQVLNNNIGMANVCYVPLSYIFMRGQSVKAHSLVSKVCMLENHLIPDLEKASNLDEGKYEGAIVFPPKRAIYYEPVIVLDYSSLYPSTAICYNISHETSVMDGKYDNLEGYKYHSITFDVDGTSETWRYAEKLDGTKGIIPRILDELLKKRSSVKKLMEKTEDPFLKKIYDGLQLAYKVTANSIYGLLGAKVSPIYLKQLAPSITAGGRFMLEYSRTFIQDPFSKLINKSLDNYEEFKVFAIEYFKEFPDYRFIMKNNYENKEQFIDYFYKKINTLIENDKRVKPKVIYGDTDSVFFTLKLHNIEDKKIINETLPICIEIGHLAGETICKTLPEPEKQVYEKTYYPFIQLGKKMYVGNLYEDDDQHFYQKSMGIVLKRRDNAKIVKVVVGGVVDFILNKRDNEKAVQYVRNILKKIVRGEYTIDNFIISKTLKGNYKKRESISHAYLADKIAARDPGNKPDVNDRIPYVYFVTPKKVKLQGEKIEDPKYLVDNKLKLDYLHYITNQIQKPCMAFLELIAENPNKIFQNVIVSEINKRKGKLPIKNYLFEKGTDNSNETNNSNDTNNSSNETINSNNSDFLQDMIDKKIPVLIEEKKVRKTIVKKKNNETEICFDKNKKFTIDI
jgi:DNA polymerase elongation subunit (family B)